MNDTKMTVDNFSDSTRVALKAIAAQVNDMKKTLQSTKVDSEVFANLTLCYRHLEDASMRLGKVKQFMNDGESIYDKNVVGSEQK